MLASILLLLMFFYTDFRFFLLPGYKYDKHDMTSAPNRIGDKVIQQQHVKLGCVKSQLHCVDDDNDFDDDDVFKVNVNLHTHKKNWCFIFVKQFF